MPPPPPLAEVALVAAAFRRAIRTSVPTRNWCAGSWRDDDDDDDDDDADAGAPEAEAEAAEDLPDDAADFLPVVVPLKPMTILVRPKSEFELSSTCRFKSERPERGRRGRRVRKER